MRSAIERRAILCYPSRTRRSGSGCVRQRQTPRLIELLWEPLAVAAFNQSIDVAGAVAFDQVLLDSLRPPRAMRRWRLPRKPLDELYAQPARRFIEAVAGRCGAVPWRRVKVRRERPAIRRRSAMSA